MAERVIDHQVASLMRERTDAERMVRLGIAALAGTIAVLGVYVQVGGDVTAPVAFGTGSGVLLLVVGIAVAGVPPSRSEAVVGPSPHDLIENLASGRIDGPALQFALLDQSAVAERHNAETLQALASRRARASQALLLGTACILFAVAYVAGGAIHA